MPGERGKIRIDVDPPPSYSFDPQPEADGGGCLASLGCLGGLFVLMMFVGMCDTGSNTPNFSGTSTFDSSSVATSLAPPTQTVGVPAFVAFRAERRIQNESRPFSVVFAYDRVRVVVVNSVNDIPRQARRAAVNEARTPAEFLRTVSSDSTHIIVGAVDITVGDLFAVDQLSVRMAIRDQQIRDLSLVLSQAPRGPPSLLVPTSTARIIAGSPFTTVTNDIPPVFTPDPFKLNSGLTAEQLRDLGLTPEQLRDLGIVKPPSAELPKWPFPRTGNPARFRAEPIVAVDAWQNALNDRPLRTIYVVGDVREFRGPDQYQASLLKAEIVDLAPKERPVEGYFVKAERPGYEVLREHRTEPWRVESAVLASAIGAEAFRRAAGFGTSGGYRPGTSRGGSKPYTPPRAKPRPGGRP